MVGSGEDDKKALAEQKTQLDEVAKKPETKSTAKSKETSKEKAAPGDVGTVLWCGSDVYLIIVAVFLVIFALFNFFGDTASKVSAALKLILAIGFVVAVSYGVVKKDARIMAGVMIAALILVIFDIIGIFVSIFGKSTIGETVTSIFFSLIRIAFLVHIFFIANKVRVAYKEEPSLPK